MTGIPSELRAGDTWSWTESPSDYSAAAGWVLAYSLLPLAGAGAKITISSSASGADHAVSVAAAITAGYAAGQYKAIARVSKAGEVHTVESLTSVVTILPDLAAATTYDSRSSARKALDKIDAWLAGDKSIEVAGYQIGDRSIQNTPLPQLIALRDRLRLETANEAARDKLAAGLRDPRNIQIRFGRG